MPFRSDPDLPHLAGTIRALLADEPMSHADTEPELPVTQLHAAIDRLKDRVGAAIDTPGSAARTVETMLTDACAENLALEAERLRTKRRMIAALADAPADPAERTRAHELMNRYRAVSDTQKLVRDLVEKLRLHEARIRRSA